MGEALETREPQNRLARKTPLQADPAPHHHEDRKHGQHPENRETADPWQLAALEIAPVAAGWLDQTGCHLVRDGDAPADLVTLLQRIQKLVFLNGFGGRLEGNLRRRGMAENEQQRERREQRLGDR